MTNTSLWYGVVEKVEDIDIMNVRVFFRGGGNHVMRPHKAFTVGSIVGVDSHGKVWVGNE